MPCPCVASKNHMRMGCAFTQFSEAAEAVEEYSPKPFKNKGLMWPGAALGRPQEPGNKRQLGCEGQLCHSPGLTHLGELCAATILNGSSGAVAEVKAQASTPSLDVAVQWRPRYVREQNSFSFSGACICVTCQMNQVRHFPNCWHLSPKGSPSLV